VTDAPQQAIEKAGFTVVTKSHVQLTAGRAAEFYAEHTGKPFFEKLCGFMSSGPLVALVLAKSDAIPAWRALMGPTNSLTAKEEAPDSLRARYVFWFFRRCSLERCRRSCIPRASVLATRGCVRVCVCADDAINLRHVRLGWQKT